VGLGALCCMCGDRRHGLLKSVELLGAWVPICHNCGALAKSLQPMPQTISAIRETLSRDRRDKDRRWGKRDSRVFRYNRRASDRRLPRDLSEVGVDDDMIVEISELVSELELLSLETMGKSQSELTSIADRPNLSD
jgi:ribosome-binding protein aMBF1 (putative translation factor)